MNGAKPIIAGVNGDQIVLDYRPREFPTLVSPSASNFTSHQESSESSGFKINPLIAEKAGISKLQAETLEKAIEAQALEKLKEVQERAYQEAFELGLLEGTEKAFDEHKEEFAARLNYLDSILKSFEDLKGRLVSENEAQMVSLIFEIAKRVALIEIKANPASIIEVIRKVVEDSQTDDRLVIRVSKEDYDFIENLKEKSPSESSSKDIEMLSKIRLEVDAKVASGGCLLDTNYGSIDASIPQRVNKAWEILAGRTPKIEASDMGLPETSEDQQISAKVDEWAAEIENIENIENVEETGVDSNTEAKHKNNDSDPSEGEES